MRQLFFASLLLTAIVLLMAGPSMRDRILAAAPLARGGTAPGVASTSPVQNAGALSPYWHAKVQRWSTLIIQEATRRSLDPDFLASLVWMESRGDPQAVGPVGAVGLMQVMPKEAGFTWRPTRDALMDPGTNLLWGTRTLATVVRQGKGDIFNALAAYNGGWEQIMYRGPKIFATTILRDYARAVARRYGLGEGWTAVFAVREQEIRGPIWVSAAGRDDVYAFGDANVMPEGGPLVPDIPPTSVLASCVDEETGVSCDVGIWILDGETQQWIAPNTVVSEPEPAAPASRVPSVFVMAGSSRPTGWASTSSQATTPSPAIPPVQNTGSPVQNTGSPVQNTGSPAQNTGAIPPTAAPVQPTAVTATRGSAAASPQPAATLPTCAGGPLTMDAWPLDREFIVGTETTPEGWKVRIYAEGRGGDCVYTYAWNDESDVRVANVRGAATFEVTSTRRDCVIVGTVVVISGDSVQRVGMYIHPPD